MRLHKLTTTGVRGLRDASFTLDPERGGAGHVTVVTGPPASGLTTFLDAIAFSAARLAVDGFSPDAADVIRSGGDTATVKSTWWLDHEERTYGGVTAETLDAEVVFRRGELGRVDADPALLGVMSRYDHTDELAKVVLMPARRVTEASFPAFADFEADQRFKRLSSDPAKFAGLATALAKHAAGLGEHSRFEATQRLFAKLCPAARLAGVTRVGQLVFAHPSGIQLSLGRLSLSERGAFVLAAATVLMGLGRSVVLLDTPEMGLAPGQAARWLGALREHTPEAQWIVASRDPEVVSSVEAAARIELVREGT